jgi:hypothetical protein
MVVQRPIFLPGVPEDLVLAGLSRAGGNEIVSGNLVSPQSNAALPVTVFQL